jgi:hypothetical protein
MSKKDYVAIADALRQERPAPHWSKDKIMQWDQCLRAVARMLRGGNPRFDTSRFVAAAGGYFDAGSVGE